MSGRNLVKIGPSVFILGMNIAKCKDMPCEKGLAEIRNSKWPPRSLTKNDTFAS